MKKLFMSFFVWLILMSAALCGCAGGKADDSSQIVVGIAQDLEDSLDPHKAVAAGTKEILFNVFEGLLKPDCDGNIVPAVAKEYRILEDGQCYEFTLRENVNFHNGKPVTAEDVKYSLEKIAGMMGDEPMIPAYSLIEKVDIIDDKTVSIHLSEKDVDFPAYLAMVNAAIIPKDNANPDTNPIGTGPFKYESRSVLQNFIIVKNEDYWGEKAYLDRVIFNIVPEMDTVVMNLRGGSLDMYAHLTTDQVNQLTDQFDVLEGTMNLVQALYLNNDVKPLNDVKVRQALCYAVNVDEMLTLTSEGKGTKIGSSMFPAFNKYYMPELADSYQFDPEKAKELLKEAGYPNGFDLEITVPSNYQPHINTAEVLVNQLKAVGINASIKLVEWNTWLNDTYIGRNYQSTVVGVDASYLTARALLERFYSTADNNFINFSSDEYDDLYEKVIIATDDNEKTAMYKRMEEILTEDAANVYLQDMAEFVALNKKFTGYEFYPLYVFDMSKIRPAQ